MENFYIKPFSFGHMYSAAVVKTRIKVKHRVNILENGKKFRPYYKYSEVKKNHMKAHAPPLRSLEPSSS